MRVRSIRLILWCLAGATTAAGVVAVVLASAMPLAQQSSQAGKAPPAHRGAENAAPVLSFDDVVNWDLLGPRTEQAPAEKIAASADPAGDAVPAPSPTLLGTIIEPGHSAALFAGPGGNCELKWIGDEVAGARLIAIQADAATLLWNSRQIVVAIPPMGAARDVSPPGPTPAIAAAPPPPFSDKPVTRLLRDKDDQAMRSFLDSKPTPSDQ